MAATLFASTWRAAVSAAALALGISFWGLEAKAGPAIVSFSGGSQFTGFSTDETVGWRFDVDPGPGLTVTSLGWWDPTPTDPLAASHEVGVWNSAGTLLGSVTVLPNSTLNGNFRYEAVTAFILAGGSTYFIGGRDLVGDGDNYISSVGSLVTDPVISFTGAARTNNAAGFAFPSIVTTNSGGRFGPNFLFDVGSTVPEPGTLALLGLGLAGLAASRSRKQ